MPEQAGRPRSGSRGRLLASGGVLGAVLVLGCPLPASAETAAPAAQCQITDPRLPELSGLVAVDGQFLAMNDGGEQVSVFLLDATCQVVDVHTADVDPYDPEDMAVAADILGLLDLAIWTLEQARQKQPLNPPLNRALARLYAKRGNFVQAIALWELVRKAEPTDIITVTRVSARDGFISR